MPATINGIGTTYAGRKNVSTQRATCESCHKLTTLTSYDTREFFCFVFIPLIPMTKYRIFDECASCRRHRRLPLVQFQQQHDNAVNPLREAVKRSPNDAQARHELIGALVGFSMTSDAEAEARAAVQ
ncbi:MAG TPA: hypothetical protein VMU84_12645, partial [Thermoanaerobaculia bacterium]|nr:hypothetical protein [Thermoanaerobaculia bacterium]